MRAAWFGGSVMSLVVSACTGAVGGAEERAVHEGALVAKLSGTFTYLELAGSCHALESLTFESSGRYRAQHASGEHEQGSFVVTAALDALTLMPDGSDARDYALEASEDLSAIQLTSPGCVEVMAASDGDDDDGSSECESDDDCEEDQTCRFAETGSTCVGKGPKPVDPDDAEACAKRTGGALITFDVHGEPLTVWSTNRKFIDDATKLVGNEGFRPTPVFDVVRAGHDACSGRAWSVDPEAMVMGDFATEVCDAMPSYVDENLSGWITAPGNYCPWGPKVVSVREQP